MTVSLGEFIASLPDAEQAAIAARADKLRAEVAALKELHALPGEGANRRVQRSVGRRPS